MARCMQCGKELTHNEIGAHRKFINRGAEQFFCKQCLAEHLGVTPELIDEKIEQFKLGLREPAPGQVGRMALLTPQQAELVPLESVASARRVRPNGRN